MAGVEVTGKQQPNNNFKPVKRTVKAKENWFKIASSYGINIHDLMRLNGFEYKNGKVINKKTGKEVPLNAGMMINVPDTSASTKTNKKETKKVPPKSAKDVPQKEIPVKPTSQKEIAPSVYTVQSGDSLYSIAREFNTTVDAIKTANNLTSNLLSIGQVLSIPSETGLETTYTVQRGDSLYSIAKKFGTDVNTLKELNNLTSNLLNIGQTLIVR